MDDSVNTSLYRDLDFRIVGPTRGDRVTAVEGHPADQELGEIQN